MKKILNLQEKIRLSNIYEDEIFNNNETFKKEWVIIDDKTFDPIRNKSDDETFPYCFLIDGMFYDAISKECLNTLTVK